MTAILVEVLIIAVLVVINALLSMSETALVSARKPRLRQAADEGSAGAEKALDLAETPTRFLATVQIGITLIGILTGVFGGATITAELAAWLDKIPILAPYSQAIGGAVVVLLLTYFSLVIGELVPKRIALSGPERIATLVAPAMSLLAFLARPLVRFLSVSTEFALRLLGIQPDQQPVVTPEEIRILIEEGTERGVFEVTEQDLIEGVLDLDERRVSALMTPRRRMVWLNLEDSLEQLREVIGASRHSTFPVAVGSLDNIVGVVRAKDLLAQLLRGEPFDVRAPMGAPVFVPESATSLDVLDLFKQQHTTLALVLDEFGGVEGMVTHADILDAIVGSDLPTGEPVSPRVVRRADGSWLIDGMTTVEEIKDALDIDKLPDEERGLYQTVGGLMMSQMHTVPLPGQHFDWASWRFEVVDMDGRRVDKVLVTQID